MINWGMNSNLKWQVSICMPSSFIKTAAKWCGRIYDKNNAKIHWQYWVPFEISYHMSFKTHIFIKIPLQNFVSYYLISVLAYTTIIVKNFSGLEESCDLIYLPTLTQMLSLSDSEGALRYHNCLWNPPKMLHSRKLVFFNGWYPRSMIIIDTKRNDSSPSILVFIVGRYPQD